MNVTLREDTKQYNDKRTCYNCKLYFPKTDLFYRKEIDFFQTQSIYKK